MLGKYLKVLLWFTIFNLVILLVRDLVEADKLYDFLIFNASLGLIPLLVAIPMYYFESKLKPWMILALGFLWLLFYPNAPYMITDLIHVDEGTTYVIYDTLIIFSFSMLSLFFGFYSLLIARVVFEKKFGARWSWIMIVGSLLLSSFGIYLGRILRLNSWDLFTHPLKTIEMILGHLWPITENPVTYVIVILFTGIQFLLLYSMKDMEKIPSASPPDNP